MKKFLYLMAILAIVVVLVHIYYVYIYHSCHADTIALQLIVLSLILFASAYILQIRGLHNLRRSHRSWQEKKLKINKLRSKIDLINFTAMAFLLNGFAFGLIGLTTRALA